MLPFPRLSSVIRALWFLITIASTVSAKEEATAPAWKNIDALFAWFDRLPLPDVSQSKMVCVWDGGWSGNRNRHWSTSNCFLLKDDGKEFVVVLDDWEVVPYKRHGIRPGTDDFVGYKEISLSDEVRTTLGNSEFRERGSRIGRRNNAAWLFVLARVCAERGDTKLSNEVMRALLRGYGESGDAGERLQQDLEASFMSALHWNAMRSFSETGITRSDLLERYRAIVDLCPHAAGKVSAIAEMIKSLEEMIDDDTRHHALSDADFAALSPEDQASELVYRLRDEWIAGKDEWIHPVPFKTQPGNGSLAALERMGFPAVPALIKAIDDKRPTRTAALHIGETAGGFQPLHVLRVGDLAVEALNKISGVNFYLELNKLPKPLPDDFMVAVRQEVVDWWKTADPKSEKDYLIENLKTGHERPLDFADRLIERYPDAAVTAIIEGIKNSSSAWDRTFLIKRLWKNQDPRGVNFFAEEVHPAPTHSERAAAANGLRLAGDSRGLSAMQEEWANIRKDKKVQRKELEVFWHAEPDHPMHVVEFLSSCGGAAGVVTLGAGLSSLPGQWQEEIIEDLASDLNEPNSEEHEAATAEKRGAVEELLVGLLKNKTSCPGPEPNGGQARLIQARVCDCAAMALHQLWPERYHFDHSVPPAARDRQCVACQNARLAEQHREPLPLPKVTKEAKFGANEVAKVLWAEDSLTPGPTLSAILAAIRDVPLNAKSIIALMTSYAANPEKTGGGLELSIWRYDAHSGITVQARLLPGSPPKAGSEYTSDGWGDFLGYSGTGVDFRSMASPKNWDFVSEAIGEALKAPPDFGYSFGFNLKVQ